MPHFDSFYTRRLQRRRKDCLFSLVPTLIPALVSKGCFVISDELNHRLHVWSACSAYAGTLQHTTHTLSSWLRASFSLLVPTSNLVMIGVNPQHASSTFTLDSDARASINLVMIGDLCDHRLASVQVVTSMCRCLSVRY